MKAYPSNGFYEKTSGGEQPQKLNPIMGMDLRDYFAAQALQGDISRYENKDNPEYWTVETVAQRAYAMADAMMKARGK